MNDHNLDDLIIDNISPKNSKTKNFLTLIALAIVVLIIAIILTKIILKDPQSQSSNIDENSVYLSPDLTLESIDTEKEIVKAPHIPTTEEVKPEITMPANTRPANNVNPMKNTHTVDDATIEAEKRKQLKAQAQEAQRQIELNEVKEAKAKEKAIAENKQKEAEKIAEKQTKTSVKHIVHPYFIQVGSFSKAPSTRFLTVITKSGFQYQITPASNGGNKKLLIGPYDTKATADQALVRVKDRINKSAYIIRK